jgi:hypothetical protein
MPRITEQDLEAELQRLEGLTRDELAAEWVKAHGVPAPKKSSREFLLKAVAHHLQVQVFGGLKPTTRKTLLKIAAQLRSGSPVLELPSPPPELKPGSRLIRAWRGETHEVVVAPDGHFHWRGQKHSSLSSIARAITGSRRNGPAFFGLRENGP